MEPILVSPSFPPLFGGPTLEAASSAERHHCRFIDLELPGVTGQHCRSAVCCVASIASPSPCRRRYVSPKLFMCIDSVQFSPDVGPLVHNGGIFSPVRCPSELPGLRLPPAPCTNKWRCKLARANPGRCFLFRKSLQNSDVVKSQSRLFPTPSPRKSRHASNTFNLFQYSGLRGLGG